ncbi:hypothetical protein N2W54_001234 [Lotmaria passim]
MAEVEFEENCAEIKDYLHTVRECREQITQIPTALAQLLKMLNTSTALLEDLCTFDDVPDTVQQRCIQSRQQMMDFNEGSAFKSLTDSIHDVVHQRLVRMEEIAQQSYIACKRRRDARAKYLSDTDGKRPFNFTAANPEKLQRHKEEYTERDEAYRQACVDFARYRYAEMGTVQRDFYRGYSGVFALLANALNLPTDAVRVGDDSSATSNTRLRIRGQQERPPPQQQQRQKPQKPRLNRCLYTASTTTRDSTGVAPPPPPLSSEESHNYQRRLSGGFLVEKPPAAATGAAASNFVPCGEVVNGIPVTDDGVYGRATYRPTGSPSAAIAPVPAARACSDADSRNSSTDKSSSSSSSCSSHNDSSSPNVEVENTTGADNVPATSPVHVRKSSNATLNHFNAVSSDETLQRCEYSILNSFELLRKDTC